MRSRLIIIISLLVFSGFTMMIPFSETVEAATLTVGPGGTYTTISSALSASSDGDIIRIYNGTYREDFTIYNSVTLIGNGTGTVILGHEYNVETIKIRESDVTIKNLSILSEVNSVTSVYIYSGHSNIRFENCNISHSHYGLRFYGSSYDHVSNINVVNCSFSAVSIAIEIKYGDAFNVSNNVFNNVDAIISATQSSGGRIDSNILTDGYLRGILLDTTVNSVVINNTIIDSSNGIRLKSTRNIKVYNNTHFYRGKQGVSLGVSAGVLDSEGEGNRIENNTIFRGIPEYGYHIFYGIYFYNSDEMIVKNNTMNNCSVYMSSSTRSDHDSHFFENNTIDGKPYYYLVNMANISLSNIGGLLLSGCENITIIDSDFGIAEYGIIGYEVDTINIKNCSMDITRFGISLRNTHTDMIDINISGCNFSGDSSDGALISLSSEKNIDQVSINGNFLSYADYGIQIEMEGSTDYSGKNISITGNHMDGLYKSGVDLPWISDYNVSDNVITNSTIGIYLYGRSTDPPNGSIVSGNTISQCGSGLSVYRSHFMNITQNIIQDCDSAILTYYCDDSIVFNNTLLGGSSYLKLIESDRIEVFNNSINSTKIGIYFDDNIDSKIHNNSLINCSDAGVYIYDGASGTVFENNTMTGCGFLMKERAFAPWSGVIIKDSNLINGRPVFFARSQDDPTIPSNVSQVLLYFCNDVTLSDLNLSNASIGVQSFYCDDLLIENCTIEDNRYGLYDYNGDTPVIVNSTISRNWDYGLYFCESDDIEMVNNSISDSGFPYGDEGYFGVYFADCLRMDLRENDLERCGIYIPYLHLTDGYFTYHNFHNNTVNGRNLTVLHDVTNAVLNGSHGQIIMIDCEYITIQSQNLSKATVGIIGAGCEEIFINGSDLSYNFDGVRLYTSTTDLTSYSLKDNRANGCANYGFYLIGSFEDLMIDNNSLMDCRFGGMRIYSIHHGSVIRNNYLSGTGQSAGIKFETMEQKDFSVSVELINNTFEFFNIGIMIDSRTFGHYYDTVVLSNCDAINSTGPGFYFEDRSGTIKMVDCRSLNSGYHGADFNKVSYISMTGCDFINSSFDGVNLYSPFSVTLIDCNLSYNGEYGLAQYAYYTIVENCFFGWNGDGGLYTGSNSQIIQNIFIENNGPAIKLSNGCEDCLIYRNRFYGNNIVNGMQCVDNGRNNDWDHDGIGNLWSDLKGPDSEGDGIVDIPYVVSSHGLNMDYFPLVPGGFPLLSIEKGLIAIEDVDFKAQLGYMNYNMTPTWNITSNADWLTISSNSTLQGTPDNDDVGEFWVLVNLSNTMGKGDLVNLTMVVLNTNDDPVINLSYIPDGIEDQLYILNIPVLDIDPTNDPVYRYLNTNSDFLTLWGKNLRGTPSDKDIGTCWVNISVHDGNGGWDWVNFTVTVFNVNDAPVIVNDDPLFITEDEHFVFQYVMFDDDPPSAGDIHTWELITDADFLTLDPDNGTLSGLPSNDDVGSYNVTVKVSDGKGGIDHHMFPLTVINVNDPPEIITEPFQADLDEDVPFQFDLIGHDCDMGDVLTWSIEPRNSFLLIDPGTGNLSGIPSNNEVGTWAINITLRDLNGSIDSIQIDLRVLNVNDDPMVNTSILPNLIEDVEWIYRIEAFDVDPTADVLSYHILGSDLDIFTVGENSGLLNALPSNSDNGFHWLEIGVQDGKGGLTTRNYTIFIQNQNDPPIFTVNSIPLLNEDQFFSFQISAIDIDPGQSIISWVIIGESPSFLSLDSSTGNISGIPRNNDVGIFTLNVRVIDHLGVYSQKEFTLEVIDTNDPPEILPVGKIVIQEDKGFEYSLSFSDQDKVEQIFSWIILDGPDFIFMNTETGIIHGMPSDNYIGTWNLTVSISDGRGGSDEVTIQIKVVNTNDPPLCASERVIIEMMEDNGPEIFDIEPLVIDPDGPFLIISSHGSENISLFTDGMMIKLFPAPNWNGIEEIPLTISDGEFEVKIILEIRVSNTNDPPNSLAIDCDRIWTEGVKGYLNGTARDLDILLGDTLEFSWSSNISGEIGFGPFLLVKLEYGYHLITLKVEDEGGMVRTISINLVVEPAPKGSKAGDGGDKVDVVDVEKDEVGWGVILIISIAVVNLLFFVAIILLLLRKKDEKYIKTPTEPQTRISEEAIEMIIPGDQEAGSINEIDHLLIPSPENNAIPDQIEGPEIGSDEGFQPTQERLDIPTNNESVEPPLLENLP